MKIGFSNEKYLEIQSQHINKRISEFGGKLYLEFGGKLYDDYHASRVLPGFEPDSKLRMLMKLKDDLEIVIVISALDIEKNKIRGDLGITYDADVLRLINIFESRGLMVGSIVITKYEGQSSSDAFKHRLEKKGYKVYLHYPIEGYPSDVKKIVSDEGYGKNDYIETTKPLVVVTAPGPGSGKMATCLSQLYQENKRGIHAGYAKFETFPIWNLSLEHPVNLAYEAATADLKDVNMIDPYHLEAYGKTCVNYNRDIEIFPVLKSIFQSIYGKSPYNSPTDMGVNMAGNCIIDDEVCRHASKKEIIRRYYETRLGIAEGTNDESELVTIELIMQRAGIDIDYRHVIKSSLDVAEETSAPAAAIELDDGSIITGKTTDLLGPASSVLLNALKVISDIPHDVHLISAEAIKPIQRLKTKYLGGHNPRLHTDETLIALSISASLDENANKALNNIPSLRGCDMHSSVILSPVDIKTLKKIGINVTTETIKEKKKYLYNL